jgi:hypothetical protein
VTQLVGNGLLPQPTPRLPVRESGNYARERRSKSILAQHLAHKMSIATREPIGAVPYTRRRQEVKAERAALRSAVARAEKALGEAKTENAKGASRSRQGPRLARVRPEVHGHQTPSASLLLRRKPSWRKPKALRCRRRLSRLLHGYPTNEHRRPVRGEPGDAHRVQIVCGGGLAGNRGAGGQLTCPTITDWRVQAQLCALPNPSASG